MRRLLVTTALLAALVLSAVVAGQQASRNRVEGKHGLAAVARDESRRCGHLFFASRLA